MKIDNWPCQFPGVPWFGQEEEQAVLDVLRRGTVFRYYGRTEPKYVAGLEAAAREFYGVRHALAVSSGTGALFTSLAALGIGPGAEVIVPAFMWVATIGAVVGANAIPVLAEVDDSLTLDPADLARKITPRTRLIIAVHMAGAPSDMDRIMAVARQRGLDVLEDVAQANGGSFRGKKLGTFGRVGVFSFQVNKNATAGEGGLIVTDDDALYERLLAVHDLGVPWVGKAPDASGRVTLWGQGRRMSELCGAVAGVQLRKLPQTVARMRASKQRIKARLQGIPGVAFRRLTDEAGDTGPFLILLLDSPERARRTADRIRAAGIEYAHRLSEYGLHIYFNIRSLVDKVGLSPAGNPWSLAENRQSVYRYTRGACPASDALFDRAVLVMIPSCLTEAQEQAAAEVIRAAVTG